MGHREWRGIGVSDFQRKIPLLGAGITSGYVGIDEYFGCAGRMQRGEIVKVRWVRLSESLNSGFSMQI